MIYNQFQDLKLSALGLGGMRLPLTDDNSAHIDENATATMVDYAMEHGINYYDTAWGYHDGQSEIVLGKVLKTYPRESFYLASKFPGYDVSNMDKVEAIFEKQLEKCGVSYFDFYLFHNVCEKNIHDYLDEKFGILTYLLKQKENGRIRHLGFSAHGSLKTVEQFLNAYGKHMEFCQLQINYLDWEFQNAKGKVALLEKFHIPIWVMEPVRGGSLSTLSKNATEQLTTIRPQESVTAWAFRFLQGLPNVKVILSGMSNMEQLSENIQTFEESIPLNEKERTTLSAIVDNMLDGKTVPCTSCRYCTTKCPKELDIPNLLSLYNEYHVTNGGFIAPMVIGTLPAEKKPNACIGCRQCENVCPQQIVISEILSDFSVSLAL